MQLIFFLFKVTVIYKKGVTWVLSSVSRRQSCNADFSLLTGETAVWHDTKPAMNLQQPAPLIPPVHPDVQMKPLPFYDVLDVLIKPSSLGLWCFLFVLVWRIVSTPSVPAARSCPVIHESGPVTSWGRLPQMILFSITCKINDCLIGTSPYVTASKYFPSVHLCVKYNSCFRDMKDEWNACV